MSSPLDRRSFLAALPGLALTGRALEADRRASGTYEFGSPRRLDAIGVQLYTLRAVMPSRTDETLASLASIGYREVELAGMYGLSAATFRAKLDASGLRAGSSHHGLSEIRGEWERTLEGAAILGQQAIVCPSIDRDEQTPDGLRAVADDFNRAGELARKQGMRFGYHNHAWELQAWPDGTRPMDLLLRYCEPGLVDWQMDIYWTVDGGADPLALIEAHPGRVTTVHVKDRTADGRMVDVGQGVIDYRTVLARAEALGMRHAFVEHDAPGDDPVASVRRSYQALHALGI